MSVEVPQQLHQIRTCQCVQVLLHVVELKAMFVSIV
jgi:hypothetical protein